MQSRAHTFMQTYIHTLQGKRASESISQDEEHGQASEEDDEDIEVLDADEKDEGDAAA